MKKKKKSVKEEILSYLKYCIFSNRIQRIIIPSIIIVSGLYIAIKFDKWIAFLVAVVISVIIIIGLSYNGIKRLEDRIELIEKLEENNDEEES